MSAFRSIATLLIGTALLMLGNGIQVTVIPLRAQIEGFTTTQIGAMGTIFFAGFAAGCLFGSRLVKKVGHIRCFAAFAALAAVGALAYPLLPEFLVWSLLRGFTGLCFAVLFMVIESWLNEQSSNEIRGSVLSLYIIIVNVVTIAGQLMVNLSPPEGGLLFILISMLISLSLVPLCLTDTAAPKPIPDARVRIGWLFKLSPSGVIGCFIVGLVEGAFWSMGPVYAQGQAFSIAQITFFMSAFVVGGTISQWPLGRLSDFTDRRWIIALCCAGTVLTGLTLAFVRLDSLYLSLGLALIHGAFMIPIYPLCLAHANDYAPTERLVEVSSALLLIYAGGAVMGPIAVAPLMDHIGPGQLFLFIAVLLALLAAYALYRVTRRTVGEPSDRVDFVPVPKTTPSVYSLEEDDPEPAPDTAAS